MHSASPHKLLHRRLLIAAAMVLLLASPLTAYAPPAASGGGLQVAYGPRGLAQLTWHGQVLADTARFPPETFHIWHMAANDLSGKPLNAPQYGWGENNEAHTWDAASKTWTYRFTWGSIRAQYQQSGDQLNIRITEENSSRSGIAFAGASIYPLALHLPGGRAVEPVLLDNITQPGVTVVPFQSGVVAISTLDSGQTLYFGCEHPGQAADNAMLCPAIVSSTRPDALKDDDLARSLARHPGLLPGHTASYTLALHFFPANTKMRDATAETDQAWRSRWPATLNWKDRRPLGTVFLASSPAAGTPLSAANPRRYFINSHPRFDIASASGLHEFQARMLAQAEQVVDNLKKIDAQGAITWDIEGEQFPQATSYVCSPDQIAAVAPEMESTVDVRGSRYNGMKLDDAYFRILRDAHFRVGLCVRPQHFVLGPNGSAQQQNLPPAQIAAELIRKMRFAHDRWGATLFYLDSTVNPDGTTLDPAILEQAAAALPDALLIPEESSPRMYRATAPFQTFIFHGDLGTSGRIRALYPQAFSANLINDADPARLAAARQELTESVRRGDILMVHAGYVHPNNATVRSIYAAAGQAR